MPVRACSCFLAATWAGTGPGVNAIDALGCGATTRCCSASVGCLLPQKNASCARPFANVACKPTCGSGRHAPGRIT
jgi:hypothetical protein